MPDTLTPTRAYLVQLPPRLVAEVDRWRVDRGMSRARAIALLLREALDAHSLTSLDHTHEVDWGACADGIANTHHHRCALGDNGGRGPAPAAREG